MMFELKDIAKSFRKAGEDVPVLAGVSLTAEKGEFVAVRGPSGAGKTTLLLIAGGLLRADKGQVICAGTQLHDLSPAGRAAFRADHIGFVFQQYHLVPYLSVIENIMLPAFARPVANVRGRADELAAQLGMEHRATHKPSELSAGEKQRVAFARAVVHRPAVLLVDEPTGNLDKSNADVLLGFLKAFAAGGGTVLMATHDDAAAACAERSVEISGWKGPQ